MSSRTGIKVRLLMINNNKPEAKPKVVFKGSAEAHAIWTKTMRVSPPSGHRFIQQETHPDGQGYRTPFLDLTARARIVKESKEHSESAQL